MKEYGLSVSALHSEIGDVELDRWINEIYASFPNCGYRIMDVLVIAWARVPHGYWHGSDVEPEGRRPEGSTSLLCQ